MYGVEICAQTLYCFTLSIYKVEASVRMSATVGATQALTKTEIALCGDANRRRLFINIKTSTLYCTGVQFQCRNSVVFHLINKSIIMPDKLDAFL